MADASAGAKSREQVLLEHKRKVSDMVRLRFARFGDELVSIVLAYALQPTQMPVLLERLEIRISSKDIEEQLDAVANFASHYGPGKFKSHALQERKKEVEPIKLDIEPEAPATPRSAPAPERPANERPLNERQAEVVTARYQGPDRRVVTDRRVSYDRRELLQAVSGNKRYGGDRRKRSKGRRKEDQMRTDFWWKNPGEFVSQPAPQKVASQKS